MLQSLCTGLLSCILMPDLRQKGQKTGDKKWVSFSFCQIFTLDPHKVIKKISTIEIVKELIPSKIINERRNNRIYGNLIGSQLNRTYQSRVIGKMNPLVELSFWTGSTPEK